MSKVSNVLTMLQLLQSGRKYSISELASILEVSERMIRVYKEELEKNGSPHMKNILANVNTIIDGPYIQEERDITLKMRGSSNQSIIDLKEKKECQK